MKKYFKSFLATFFILTGVLTYSSQSVYAMDCLGRDRPYCTGAYLIRDIPSSLVKARPGSYYINLNKFTSKIRGTSNFKDPKTGWVISRDKATGNSHGGSYWKLLNKKGDRMLTLGKDGTILRK